MIKKSITLALVLLFLTSCKQESSPSTSITFQASSTAPRSVTMGTNVEITKFIISIKEVKFKIDKTVSDPNEVFFVGPFTLNLISDSEILKQSIGDSQVPEGVYEAIRFKLHKTTDESVEQDIFDRSIFIAGTIGNVPFEMWHDTSENIDVGENTGIIIGDDSEDIIIDFNVQAFLDQSLNGGTIIDLSTASDGDSDNIIEINPNSEDGTTERNLADSLKDNIKLVAEIKK